MRILRPGDGVTMNRSRVLADAKARCLRNGERLHSAQPAPSVSRRDVKRIIDRKAHALESEGKITGHDVVVSKVLSNVLCGGSTNMWGASVSSNCLTSMLRPLL